VKDTIQNSDIDNITNSLNSISVALKKSAISIADMKAKSSEDLTNTIFIPYFKPSQFMNEIRGLSEGIIIVLGIDTESADFTNIKNNAWLMYEKIVVGESHGEMVKNHTDIYVDMFKTAKPRNTSCKPMKERTAVHPKYRYDIFVDLVNQCFTMKEIAVEMGLSVPSTYLLRKEHRNKLLNDKNVLKNAPAMKFNCKRK
jgi:hypothetical protein